MLWNLVFKKGYQLIIVSAILSAAGCSQRGAEREAETVKKFSGEQKSQEQLLKGDINLHDPAGIVEDGGYLMTFATGRAIKYRYVPPGSDEWVVGDRVFPRGERPEWMAEYIPNNKGFWAPHIPFPRVLYYSTADDSQGRDIGCIGRATAVGQPPDLEWIDDSEPVLCCDRDSEDEPFAIDPAVFKGEGETLWLVYGSHWSGIWVVELDPETGHIKDEKGRLMGWSEDNPAFHFVASELGRYHQPGEGEEREEQFTAGRIEAPYVFWNGDYYYLFVNWGICCSGVNSTYEIRIGRSKKPTGPYLDKRGKDMREAGGTLFLGTQGRFIGPGHANIFEYADSQGKERFVFTYHFYDGEDNGRAKMNARELIWNDSGWPVLTNKVFYKKE